MCISGMGFKEWLTERQGGRCRASTCPCASVRGCFSMRVALMFALHEIDRSEESESVCPVSFPSLLRHTQKER